MRQYLISFIALLFFSLTVHADNTPSKFDESVNTILQSHFTTYKDKEYFSGIALSIYTPKQPTRDYYIGQVSHDPASKKIDKTTLFQIGSITKSFTAALLLQLEKENKLRMKDTLHTYLPAYSKWANTSLESLLNMTSGLPNYSNSPSMNYLVTNHPERVFTDKELIDFIYPPNSFSPPLKPGYYYTNTSYILASMIIEGITHQTFQENITKRLIQAAKLENTIYPSMTTDTILNARMASGYGYNPYDNPELVGKDIRNISLSWAAAAGAAVSSPSDVIKWIKALFIDNTILDSNQKAALESLISTDSGKPISTTSEKDPAGFGLGVAQKFDPAVGKFWFYEGETLGFRALYMYVPESGIIICSIFNSAVNAENDHAHDLMKQVYALTKANMSARSN